MKSTQVLVQTKGFDLTEAIEKYCQERAEKLMRHDAAITGVEFFLSGAHKRGFQAKLKLDHKGKDLFYRDHEPGDLYEAIKKVYHSAKEDLSKNHKH